MSKPLFKVLDDILYDSPAPRYVILLADSGMGKTTALINYYARNLRRQIHKDIVLLYLGTPRLLSRISSVKRKGEKMLFLDALDEDTKALADHRRRVYDVMDAARGFECVVISCRTQFFLRDEEIARDTGIMRYGPRAAGESGNYDLLKLYLVPFTTRQVDAYVRKRYPIWRQRQRRLAREVIARIADLSSRPMLLAYIDDLITGSLDLARVTDAYERIVTAWLERERAHVGNVEAMRTFSERLAVDLYLKRSQRRGEAIAAAEIAERAAEWNVPIDRWNLTGRSLLTRDAAGQFRFAHRSIMEYLFVVAALGGDAASLSADWTDQMIRFGSELLLAPEARAKLLPYVDGILAGGPGPGMSSATAPAGLLACVRNAIWQRHNAMPRSPWKSEDERASENAERVLRDIVDLMYLGLRLEGLPHDGLYVSITMLGRTPADEPLAVHATGAASMPRTWLDAARHQPGRAGLERLAKVLQNEQESAILEETHLPQLPDRVIVERDSRWALAASLIVMGFGNAAWIRVAPAFLGSACVEIVVELTGGDAATIRRQTVAKALRFINHAQFAWCAESYSSADFDF
ncbi:MAG: hypothetical protein HY084_10185 [Gemmatimonadetes bacterium]|nr:hypothetical protein [Gemmatimonadota bacterium]